MRNIAGGSDYNAEMTDFAREFIRFAIAEQAVSFGEFKTKAGRLSPYFFNAGRFSNGASLDRLAQFYAKAVLASGLQFDMLFGPAYKGIPLVAAVAVALAQAGRNAPFSFNRKEQKDHGEGGSVIGAKLEGRVLIVDDVISAGTAVGEACRIIRAHGARPCGLVIALDRMERGAGTLSAVQEVEQMYGLSVVSVATLEDLIDYLGSLPEYGRSLAAVDRYRQQYGVKAHA